MKKFVALALTLVMALSLTACGESSSTPADDSSSNNGEGDTSTITPQTIKICQPQVENTPEDAATKAMAAKIEELSGGAIKCEVYATGQLGSIPESIQLAQLGSVQIAIGPCAIVSSYCEDTALVDLPYLLPNDVEVIDEVMNGDLGHELMDRMDDVGLHTISFWFGGFRQMTANRDINSVADMKNLKMRIMESNILTSTYKALGAQPIVVAYSETYNALQNGTVDAQENPAQSTYSMNFYEVQKYIVDTYHDSQAHLVMINKGWWDSLSPEVQDIITEAADVGRQTMLEQLPPFAQDCVDKMVAYGCVNHALSDEAMEEFKTATRPVWDEFMNTEWRADYVTRLEAAFNEAMAAKG